MDALVTRNMPTSDDQSPVTGARRSIIVQLYLTRLSHLLELEPDQGAYQELTREEQRHLRSRAVLSTVRTLTSLQAGPAASERLRRARRRA